MKKLMRMVDNDYQIMVFAILGVGCIFFPTEIQSALPYVLGVLLIAFGLTRLIVRVRRRNLIHISLSWSVIITVLGCIIFIRNINSISTIGSIWAMLTLIEAAEEVDFMFRTRNISHFHLVLAILSALLAFYLLFNPTAAFTHHVRILGVEMILQSLVEQHAHQELPDQPHFYL